MSSSETKNTFKTILKRSNKNVMSDRAKRICAVAKMEYDSLIAEKKKKIFKLEDQIEAMTDLSTSNVTTTANAIKAPTFDASKFVQDRSSLKYKLAIAKEELELLEEDSEFYG